MTDHVYYGRCVGGPRDQQWLAHRAPYFYQHVWQPVSFEPPSSQPTMPPGPGFYRHQAPRIDPEWWYTIPKRDRADEFARLCVWVWNEPEGAAPATRQAPRPGRL